MRIVCQQTILMKYHALFVNFEKAAIIIGGALWVNASSLNLMHMLFTLCVLMHFHISVMAENRVPFGMML